MAENEVEIKAERKRQPKFSINEMSVIIESVRKNLDIIQSKLTNNVTNKKKKTNMGRDNERCERSGKSESHCSRGEGQMKESPLNS